MTTAQTLTRLIARARRRLSAEHGFTMMIALGVMTVTSLLVAATFVAVNGDVNQTQHDLSGKEAYYAARAGENAFLYQLNQDPNYWTNCVNDYKPTPVSVPGTTTSETYSYVPVYNVGYSNTSCSTANAIAALIDAPSGTLRMEFTGYAGTPTVSRTIVSSFRKASPLDYLWYTDHEMEDPALNSNCLNEKYYYQYSNPGSAPCPINWVSGDTMSGPLYTNDQYLIYNNASPTFGRSGMNDATESSAPKIYGICVANNCQNARFLGLGAVPGAQSVALPSSNSSTALLQDATANGMVISGTTTITLNGGSATLTNCPGATASVGCSSVNQAVSLTSTPIIYVQNATGCPATYTLTTTYSKNNQGYYYGTCGDVYLSGNYTSPVTIVTDHDIIIVANNPNGGGVTTTEDSAGNPIGNATLGLVAADFVRIMHSANTSSNAVTVDAAILTLSHSFMVDNFNSGSGTPPKLTVHGAIAQRYRGIVGQVSGTGYLKNYHYDDRLQVELPPYLFDIAISGWKIVRETLCTQTTITTDMSRCSYNGP